MKDTLMPSEAEIRAAARAICELDGVQCQCICAPETRGSVKRCEGPFAQAKAALEAAERVRYESTESRMFPPFRLIVDPTLPPDTFEIHGVHGVTRFILPSPPESKSK